MRLATAEAGIRYAGRTDVLLALFDPGTTVAGVFTRSKCPSAPVEWCRAHLKTSKTRVLVVNSGNANAFTGKTGRDACKFTAQIAAHVLIRSRAIENGCFVFAAAQGGHHENGRDTFGHSLIVDPWGRIIAEGGTEPGVIVGEINPAEVVNARARVPSLQHGRRFEIVEPLAEPAHLHVVRGAE